MLIHRGEIVLTLAVNCHPPKTDVIRKLLLESIASQVAPFIFVCQNVTEDEYFLFTPNGPVMLQYIGRVSTAPQYETINRNPEKNIL